MQPWCIWWYWILPRSPIPHSIGSKCHTKADPCQPIPIHLQETFKQVINKMLKVGVLKPVHEAIPWINSFVLIEGKDKLGNLKLRICLDPTNLTQINCEEPYHFKTPKDIVHLLADACVMTVCDLKKGYCHQQLDKASSFKQHLIQNLEDLDTQWCLLEQQLQEMSFSASLTSVWEDWASYCDSLWHHDCQQEANP